MAMIGCEHSALRDELMAAGTPNLGGRFISSVSIPNR
jgi:hypothetical protein